MAPPYLGAVTANPREWRPGALPGVTVLTPTYNRARTLPRLFDSLCAQTHREFEWLIVDDGSTDGTAELVRRFERDAPFEVRYVQQPNRGYNSALNRGIQHARQSLCVTIGSDDWLVEAALTRMLEAWLGIHVDVRERFANVEGRVATPGGELRGKRPAGTVDSDYFDWTYVRGATGDTVGMWRTDVRRDHPIPEDLGEKAAAEAIAWNRIARRYRTRYVDEVWAHVDYSPDGLTHQDLASRMRHSRAQFELQRELLANGRALPAGLYLKAHANLIRHAIHNGVATRAQLRASRSPLAWAATLPVGGALAMRDRRAVRKTSCGPHKTRRS